MYAYKKNNYNINDKKIIQTFKRSIFNFKVKEQGVDPKKKVSKKIKNDEEGKIKKGAHQRIKSNDNIIVVDRVRKKKEDTYRDKNEYMNEYMNKYMNKYTNKYTNKYMNKYMNKELNGLIKYKTPCVLNAKNNKVMKLLKYPSCMEKKKKDNIKNYKKKKSIINKNNIVNNSIYKYSPLDHKIKRDTYNKHASCKVVDKNDKICSNYFLLNNNISINQKRIGGMDIKKKKIIITKKTHICDNKMDNTMNNYHSKNKNIYNNDNQMKSNNNSNNNNSNNNNNYYYYNSSSNKGVDILSISNCKEKYTTMNKHLCLQNSNFNYKYLKDEKKKIKSIKNNIINDYIYNESHNINNINLKNKLLYKKDVIRRNKSSNSKYPTKKKLICNENKNMDTHKTVNSTCPCKYIKKQNVIKKKDKDHVQKLKNISIDTLSKICVDKNGKYKNTKKNNLFVNNIKNMKLKTKNDNVIKLWIAHKRNELIMPYHEKCITNCYTSKIIKNKEIKNEHSDRNNLANNYFLTIEGRQSGLKCRRKNSQDENGSTNKSIMYLTQDEGNIYPLNKNNNIKKKREKEYEEEFEDEKNKNIFKENHSFEKKLFIYNDKEEFYNNIKNKRRCVSLNNINEAKKYNPLFITNDFRLKMCYSNDFIDYRKIYNSNSNKMMMMKRNSDEFIDDKKKEKKNPKQLSLMDKELFFNTSDNLFLISLDSEIIKSSSFFQDDENKKLYNNNIKRLDTNLETYEMNKSKENCDMSNILYNNVVDGNENPCNAFLFSKNESNGYYSSCVKQSNVNKKLNDDNKRYVHTMPLLNEDETYINNFMKNKKKDICITYQHEDKEKKEKIICCNDIKMCETIINDNKDIDMQLKCRDIKNNPNHDECIYLWASEIHKPKKKTKKKKKKKKKNIYINKNIHKKENEMNIIKTVNEENILFTQYCDKNEYIMPHFNKNKKIILNNTNDNTTDKQLKCNKKNIRLHNNMCRLSNNIRSEKKVIQKNG
ncbi:hypothetical protein PGSY75_0804700, partial [Plasmodium gaboni]